jgi:hypothetical protein
MQNFNYALENAFEFMEQEMLIRIESFNVELDKHSYFFDKRIDLGHWQVLDELDKINEIERKVNEFKANRNDFASFQNLLKNYSEIRASLSEISNRLYDLSYTTASFHLSTRKFPKFKNTLVGKLMSSLKPVDLFAFKSSKSTLIDLSEEVTNLSSLCQLDNNNFLALDSYLNSIVEFDAKFKFIRSVCLNEMPGVQQQKITFNSNFYSILANKKSVFINNMESNEVIVVDRALSRIDTIFSPAFESSRPIFLCECYRNTLFILNYKERLILVYDDSVSEVNRIKLEQLEVECNEKQVNKANETISDELINTCNTFTINDKFIAVSVPFLTQVHIYNLEGKRCQKIEIGCHKTSLCLADELLVCFSRWSKIGSILVYELKVELEERDEEDEDLNDNTETTAEIGGEVAEEEETAEVDKEDKNELAAEDSSLLKFTWWCCRKDLKTKEKFCFMFSHKSIVFYQNCLMVLFSRECMIVLIPC